MLAAGVVAVAPLALSTVYDLPAEIFALTPMALWIALWIFVTARPTSSGKPDWAG